MKNCIFKNQEGGIIGLGILPGFVDLNDWHMIESFLRRDKYCSPPREGCTITYIINYTHNELPNL